MLTTSALMSLNYMFTIYKFVFSMALCDAFVEKGDNSRCRFEKIEPGDTEQR